jgi:UDP-N-acetylglucosamine 2-epimerase (non-hydrolysing)/UDP-GlcNAc3NAcA epimerase
MKIITIVGARPQFVKAAAVSRVLRQHCDEVIVHTGQHYDKNMSDVFFEELGIPKPDYYLQVGSNTRTKQIAEIMIRLEDVLIMEKPDYIIVYGDTNSTLAGALVARNLDIPIIHIEAGLRSFNNQMPEENNRIITDRISTILFCPTEAAIKNLADEGRTNGVYMVGDVMCDAVFYYSTIMEQQNKNHYIKKLIGVFNKIDSMDKWYLATIHRAENTNDLLKLSEVLDALERLNHLVLFPVHPRIKFMVKQLFTIHQYTNINFVEPIGYLDMLYFLKNSVKVITDSGGLQKEAYLLNIPCITLREETEWVETLKGNLNVLCKINTDEIQSKVYDTVIDNNCKLNYYGDGATAIKICDIIRNQII